MDLGKSIRLCRTQRELNQLELADRAEISVSYLSLLERGKRDPVISTIEKIASALNIPVSILVFLATSADDSAVLGSELQEKLSYVALQLIKGSNPPTE